MGKKTGSALVISSLYKLQCLLAMVMKTFLHVAISGMVAFSSHVAILVCRQAELCYVYVFVFEFVSFLSESDVIF